MINFLGAGGKVFALHRVIEVVRSTPPISFVGFNHLPPHPLGLVRLRNGRPSMAINGQAPNSPSVQGKSGIRLATSPAKDWL